ncbi:MAG: ABC transporter ATP-binding protein [Candidatus Saccharicenans sp.]
MWAIMARPILSAVNLKKVYREKEALASFSLALEEGELLCLVGPDGSGKSTALRLLCGLEKADDGEIYLFGEKTVRFSPELRKRIGYMPQSFSLYEDLTVEENLEFFHQLYRIADEFLLIDELLELTRLKPFKNRKAKHLSGGMKQKLALACTLVHRPDILLLDEPTTGVDPVSRRDFWQILFRLLGEGKAIIMATPYLDEAERASRTAFILEGRVLACDHPEKLKKIFQGRLLEIISAENRQLYHHLKGRPETTGLQILGHRIHLALKEGVDPEALKEKLDREGFKISHFTEIEPSLEDVFVFLIRRTSGGENETGHRG